MATTEWFWKSGEEFLESRYDFFLMERWLRATEGAAGCNGRAVARNKGMVARNGKTVAYREGG